MDLKVAVASINHNVMQHTLRIHPAFFVCLLKVTFIIVASVSLEEVTERPRLK